MAMCAKHGAQVAHPARVTAELIATKPNQVGELYHGSVWFNSVMYIEGRVEGVQMPWQSRLSSGYAATANQLTQASQVPPLPTSSQVRGPFPVGEGLFLSSRVARGVAGFVKEPPGIREPV